MSSVDTQYHTYEWAPYDNPSESLLGSGILTPGYNLSSWYLQLYTILAGPWEDTKSASHSMK